MPTKKPKPLMTAAQYAQLRKSGYRGAGAAPLTRAQELSNLKQVNVERLQKLKADHAAARAKINAKYASRKKAFNKTRLPRGK